MSVAGETFQYHLLPPVETLDCRGRCLLIFQSSIILLCVTDRPAVPEECTKSETSALLKILCTAALHCVSCSSLEP